MMGLILTVIVGLIVVLGVIALFIDYLRSYNDQLRERNIELSARQRERERWLGANPEAFAERVANMVRSSISASGGVVVAAAPAPAAVVQPVPPVPVPVSAMQAPAAEPVFDEPDYEEAELEAEPEPASRAATPRPPRPRRERQRRETPHVDTWVSKEELERLAERAARIRARYGNLALDAPEGGEMPVVDANLAAADEVVVTAGRQAAAAAPPVETPVVAKAPTLEFEAAAPPAIVPAPDVEEVPEVVPSLARPVAEDERAAARLAELRAAAEQTAHRNEYQPLVEQASFPNPPSELPQWPDQSADAALAAEREAESQQALAELPAPTFNRYADDSDSDDRYDDRYTTPESIAALEPEPAWPIPQSPAQARTSAAVDSWRASEPVIAETPVTPIRQNVTPQQPELPSSAAAGKYDAVKYAMDDDIPLVGMEEAAPEPHGAEIDALFDQTYGSPSWLKPSAAAAPALAAFELPYGLFEENELDRLIAKAPSFTGVAVSIRINDYASLKPKLNSQEGTEALSSLGNLIRSLLREDRDFGCRAQEDEYVLLFPGDTGDEGQRRLFHLSERLWDFQLRSLGGIALMLSWGGLEVDGQPIANAVTAAREKLEESRRGRARPGSTFRSARRAS